VAGPGGAGIHSGIFQPDKLEKNKVKIGIFGGFFEDILDLGSH